MIVARTDMAYPDLWVAPGSKNTALGQHYGIQENFVTGGRGLGMWQMARLQRDSYLLWGTVAPRLCCCVCRTIALGWDINACLPPQLAALGVLPPDFQPCSQLPIHCHLLPRGSTHHQHGVAPVATPSRRGLCPANRSSAGTPPRSPAGLGDGVLGAHHQVLAGAAGHKLHPERAVLVRAELAGPLCACLWGGWGA